MSKKSQSQTEQNTSTKSTWRVNGVSLTIAIVLYLVALFGAIWMDNAAPS
jgi:predicted negative regulator of RcsB-dependent stress response